jgi:3-isopropylmalate/(R)-2-methylmalate dehydratase large subunit
MRRSQPRTLFEKIWSAHVVVEGTNADLIYIDRHLIHEVTSPQAFEGLRLAGRRVRRPDLTLAVADHNVPTIGRWSGSGQPLPVADRASARQLDAIARNTSEFGIRYIDPFSSDQGIVHIVGPEQGFTLPGCTLACGDSHTAVHGAFGTLAFGIGTSEVEHILATQTLRLPKPKAMKIQIDGEMANGTSAKDIVLTLIGRMGAAGARGYVVEFAGSTVQAMSLEERATICNMSIEFGARSAIIAPDEKVFDFLTRTPHAPVGAAWQAELAEWCNLQSDPEAIFRKEVLLDAAEVAPSVTWGTSPEDVLPITGVVPYPDSFSDPGRRAAAVKSLQYMGLEPGTRFTDISIEHVFIGSCTNGRIEDLRAAAAVVEGRAVAAGVHQALVVPGSSAIKRSAEREGLDRIFIEAGFEWREAGCSMCLAMNADKVPPGERCASTSNRNFVGRQGPGARTHLLSPAMAAAAAITGHLTDVRELSSNQATVA